MNSCLKAASSPANIWFMAFTCISDTPPPWCLISVLMYVLASYMAWPPWISFGFDGRVATGALRSTLFGGYYHGPHSRGPWLVHQLKSNFSRSLPSIFPRLVANLLFAFRLHCLSFLRLFRNMWCLSSHLVDSMAFHVFLWRSLTRCMIHESDTILWYCI